MQIEVKLFAAAEQLAGARSLVVDLPAGATVGDLRHALARQNPSLSQLLPSAAFAVNADYASDDVVIPERAEIACIPPVSGG